MIRSCLRIALVVSVALFLLGRRVSATAVISIDFGEDIRIGLIQTGQRSPMNLVLNKESMRTSVALVAITKNEVFVSTDAGNIAARSPENAYGLLKNLLGKRIDQVGRHFRETYFAADLVKDPFRGETVAILNANHDTPFTIEELCGYLFAYIKQTAESAAAEAIGECVIAVPPYFDIFAKNALMDAARLAGFKVLEIMSDVTAAAFRYALSVKCDDKPQHYLFGSLGRTATSFARVAMATRVATNTYGANVTVPHVDVLDVRSVADFGGLDVDLLLRERVLAGFFRANPDIPAESVRSNVRVMNRILRECTTAKHKLSLSTDYTLYFDSLVHGRDFNLLLTRSLLDEVCVDLQASLRTMAQSLITPDVSSVVLVGGHSRIKFVQDLFKGGYTGDDGAEVAFPPLSSNIDVDEAVALGACLRAAILSRKFVVTQDIRIREHWPFDVSLEISQDDPAQAPSTVALFSGKSSLDAKKVITLKKKKDFDIRIFTRDGDASGAAASLVSRICVKNVESVLDGIKEQHIEGEPQVKVTVRLTNSGLLTVDGAVLFYTYLKEVTVPQPSDSVAAESRAAAQTETPLDANEDNGAEAPPEANSKDEQEQDQDPTKADEASPSPGETEKTDASPAEKTQTTTVKGSRSVDLAVEQTFVQPSLSPAQIEAAYKRAAVFEKFRQEKYLYESTRNELESAAYQFKHMLDDESYVVFIAKETQDAIRKDISRMLEALEAEPPIALAVTQKEIGILKGWQRPIDARRKNDEERPEAIKKLKQALDDAGKVLDAFEPKSDGTSEVLKQSEDLQTLLQTNKDWLRQRQEQQATLPKFETPILWAKDCLKKAEEVQTAALSFQKVCAKTPVKKTESAKGAKKSDTGKKDAKPAPPFDFDMSKLKEFGLDNETMSSPEKLKEMLEKLKGQFGDLSKETGTEAPEDGAESKESHDAPSREHDEL